MNFQVRSIETEKGLYINGLEQLCKTVEALCLVYMNSLKKNAEMDAAFELIYLQIVWNTFEIQDLRELKPLQQSPAFLPLDSILKLDVELIRKKDKTYLQWKGVKPREKH